MEKNENSGARTKSRGNSRAYLSLAMAALTLLPLTAVIPNLPAVAAEEDTKTMGLDSPRLVLKGSEQFLVLDPDGMIVSGTGSPYGL